MDFTKKYISFFIGVFFCVGISCAQNQHVDSLKKALFKSGEDTSRVSILNALVTESENRAQHDSSMKYAEQAKLLAEKLNYKKGIAQAFGNIGLINYHVANYAEASKNYFEALRIQEETGDSKGLVRIYVNIANIYIEQRRFKEADSNLVFALKTSEKINYRKGIEISHTSMGHSLVRQGNFAEALTNYLAAEKIQQEFNDRKGLSTSYNNIGVVYMEQGLYEKALKNYFACLAINEEMGAKSLFAGSYDNIGETFFRMKKYSDAIVWLTKATEAAQQANDKFIRMDAYSLLSKTYEASGDYKKSLLYHKLYFDLNDSLYNEKTSKQLIEMKTNYETEKKDKDIQLLNKDKEIQAVKINRQRAAIWYLAGGFILLILFALIYFRIYNKRKKILLEKRVTETEMKALRSQMNPHFTFNVLNSIQYYMSENDTESAELYLEKFASLIRMILDQSRVVYIVLEQEISMLKLYMELEEMMFKRKFTYSVDIAENLNPERILIPGMLIQPIVENSIKHGLAQKNGTAFISISFSSKDSVLLCTVTDDGIGREAAGKLKNTSGRYGEIQSATQNGTSVGRTHKSVATKIIRERIEALSSIYDIKLGYKTEDLFDVENRPIGTRVSMELPMKIENSESNDQLS